MPQRIQRKRVKGWRMPPDTVYVGRPTKWGNPYPLHIYSMEESLKRYGPHVGTMVANWPDFLAPLRGKDLACWCKEGSPCHADILLRLANPEGPDEAK